MWEGFMLEHFWMRVSSGESFLSIERAGFDNGSVVWRMEAEMTGESWRFAFIDCRMRVESPEEARHMLGEFEAREIQRLYIMLSEGSWLRVKWDLRGHVLIGYNLVRPRSGAAVHGEVVVGSEAGAGVCREIAGLL